jgi:hypothetical protein
MEIHISPAQFVSMLVAAIQADRKWPGLRQFDWTLSCVTGIDENLVTLDLPTDPHRAP